MSTKRQWQPYACLSSFRVPSRVSRARRHGTWNAERQTPNAKLTLALALFALCPVSADAGLFGHSGPSAIYLAISESSAAQQSEVQAQVQRLNAELQAGTRHGPTLRYIALPTLNPTKAQIEAYLERRGEAEGAAAARRRKLARIWVDPSRLRCLMVWDLQSNSLVTRNCYLVGSLPDIGTASKFEDVTAEFAGQQ